MTVAARGLAASVLLAAMLATGTSALAGPYGIDEARFGGHWAQPDWLDKNHQENDQAGISAELLFTPVNIDLLGIADGRSEGFLVDLVTPRPTVGGMVNLDSDGTNYAYAGLTWQFGITEVLFIEGGFGLAVNDGEKDATANRAGLGSTITFRESVALGVNLTPNMTALVQWEHLSHAELFDDSNRGLTNISAKLGYKF